MEEIVQHCVELATNKSGCCVLQHCLEHVDDGEQKRHLISEIVANALILSGDAFGYVVTISTSVHISSSIKLISKPS